MKHIDQGFSQGACWRPAFFSFRFGLLALSLLCTLLLAAATTAQATHYRYGSLTWRQDLAADPSGKTIVFKVSQAFREDFPWPGGPPTVGSTENTGNLTFGDASAAPILLAVTSVDIPDNSFFGEVEIRHTYSSPGSYVAFFTGGDRLSTLQNNPDGLWYVKTNVTAGLPTNSSPISTLPAVVNLAVGQAAATFTVPGTDPNGNSLTYSLATPADLAVPFVNAPGLSITPTGVASFSTAGKTVGQLYNAIVKISDGSTTIMVDFLIRIVGPSASPQFAYGPGQTPANGATLQVVAGQNLSFNVQAFDPDAADAVSLQGNGLPLGSTFAVPPPANPVASVFSWTPGPADVGSYVVNFTAQDPVGVQALTSVTINVILCNISASATGTNVSCNGGSNGAIDLLVTGGTAPLRYSWTGPNGFTASTEDLTDLPAGTYNVTVTDANNCNAMAQAILTQPAPVPVPTIGVTPTSSVFTGGPATTIYLGYGAQSVRLTASGGDGNYTWAPATGLSGTSGATVTAAPTVTTTYTVTATNAAGCTATASVTITVVDVRCGNNNDKVLVCHDGHEICISPSAVPAHLTLPSHTDALGACSTGARNAGLSGTLAVTNLEVFPNPVGADQATILFRSAQASPVTVQIYNQLGVLVATPYKGTAQAGQVYQVDLNSRQLANGIYQCRLLTSGQTKTMRLVVSR